jgi:hypothetical protein
MRTTINLDDDTAAKVAKLQRERGLVELAVDNQLFEVGNVTFQLGCNAVTTRASSER